MRALGLLVLIVIPALAWAQSGVPADPVKVIDSQGRPSGAGGSRAYCWFSSFAG